MKPVRLTIAGLQSFREEQVIDFTRLSEMGVFGIFGPTGSGKSTILDAITLALYGTVIRAERDTQGIINQAENTLTVSFEFELGTSACRRTYRAERRYRRRNDLSVTNTYSRLIEIAPDGTETVLADKDREVKAAVTAVLGLTADDFLRAVVLPQGRFAEFLRLSGAERREMLQRLFGLEKYGRQLAEKLSARSAQVDGEYSEVVSEQRGLGDASAQAVKTAEQAADAARQAEQAAGRRLQQAQAAYDEAAGIRDLCQQLAEKTKQLEVHRLQAQEIASAEAAIAQAEAAARLMPVLEEADAAAKREMDAAQAAGQAVRKAAELAQKVEDYKQAWHQAEIRRQKESERLIARKTQLETLLVVEKEAERLAQEVSDQSRKHNDCLARHKILMADLANTEKESKALAEKEQRLNSDITAATVSAAHRALVADAAAQAAAVATAVSALNQAEADLKLREKELTDATCAAQTASQAVKKFTATLAALEDAEKEAAATSLPDISQLAEQEVKLVALKGQAERLAGLEEEQERCKNAITTLDQEAAELLARQKTAEASLRAAENEVRDAEKALTELALRDKRAMAARLAGELAPGAPCPVCGSVDHPCPATMPDETKAEADRQVLAAALEAAQEALAAARRTYEQVAGKLIEVRTKRDHTAERRQTLIDDIAAIRTLLPKWASSKTGLDLKQAIDTELARLTKQRAERQAWDKARQLAQQEIQTTNKRLADARAEYTAAQQRLVSADQEYKTALQRRDECQTNLNAAEAVLRKTLAGLGESVSDLRNQGIKRVQAIQQEIAAKDKAAEKARQELGLVKNRLQAYQQKLEELRQQESKLQIEITSIKSLLDEKKRQLTVRRQELTQSTGGRSVSELLADIDRQLAELEQLVQDAQRKYEKADQDHRLAEDEVARLTTLAKAARESKERAHSNLTAQLAREGFASAQAARAAFMPPADLAARKEKVARYHDQVRLLNAEIDALQKRLGGKTLSDDQWEKVATELEEAKQVRDMAIRQQAEADRVLKDLVAKHERWQELEKRREDLEKQRGLLATLRDLFRGNRFVEFIAQEQMEMVAAAASERLKHLTRGRYALEINSEGGFIIRDDMNGGWRRPVSSLSGGETFQTSLALALALSTQIQLRGKYPLEFFFLDEGFGSLDQVALDTVMASLERLHGEKLTVGIISHISELKQRMPRRLIVEPPEPAGRGSRVRMEMA